MNRPGRSRHARLGVLGVMLVLTLGLGLAACIPVEQLPAQASQYCVTPPTSAAGYQQAFDGLRTVWTEWAAADGGLPTTLPDGRVLWTFGDTLVGRVRSNGSVADPSSWVHNSFVVQTAGCFAPLMGGTRGARTEIVPNAASNEWYWPSDAVVEPASGGSDQLRVFLLHLRTDPNGTGGFDFKVLGTSMATFSLPGLQQVGQTVAVPIPTAPTTNPQYGQTVTTDCATPTTCTAGNYLYAYGPKDLPPDPYFPVKEHRIARVPLGQESNAAAWQYGAIDVNDAVMWGPVASSATPMHFAGGQGVNVPNGPRGPLAVLRLGDGTYVASGMPIDAFSGAVDRWEAPNAWGPWTNRGTVVSGLANWFQATWTYGGRVVSLPGIATGHTVLWSQNHNPVSDIVANNAWYKVSFAGAP